LQQCKKPFFFIFFMKNLTSHGKKCNFVNNLDADYHFFENNLNHKIGVNNAEQLNNE
jgi:hypothetical protein